MNRAVTIADDHAEQEGRYPGPSYDGKMAACDEYY